LFRLARLAIVRRLNRSRRTALEPFSDRAAVFFPNGTDWETHA
jgi:hypothetical protein